MNDQGLSFQYLSVGNPQINAQFVFYDGGRDVAAYFFKSWDLGDLQSSREYIPAETCTLVQGSTSSGDVPDRATQALLMTIEAAPATAAVQSKRLRLVLDGIRQWEWDVRFEIPMFPFRLDGTWTQTR